MIFVMILRLRGVCLRFSEASDMVLPFEKVAPCYVVGIVGTSSSPVPILQTCPAEHRRQNYQA